MKNIIYIFIALAFVGCRTISKTTTTKTTIKIEHHDTIVSIPVDSIKTVIQLPKADTLGFINLKPDTFKTATMEIITQVVKGKLIIKAKTLPEKKIEVKGLNTNTVVEIEKKEVVVLKPSFWERVGMFWTDFKIFIIIGVVLMLLWRFRKLIFAIK